MSELVSYHLDDGIATLTLNNGKVNALSPAVIEALDSALTRAEQDGAVVVLTGQPGVFSGGYDLKVMTSSPQAATELVAAGSTLTRRMLASPCPVVVACSGHAIAKGAFLLLAADHRIGVSGPFQIGLNEVMIGMTMHHAGIALARGRLSVSGLQRAVVNAEMFSPALAQEVGFLDQVSSPESLLSDAHAAARQLAKLNRRAHAATKLKVRQALLAELDEAIVRDRQHLLTA